MGELRNGSGQRHVVHRQGSGIFAAGVRFEPPALIVTMTGELDLAGRETALRACLAHDASEVTVDLSGLRFMDCAGYGALAEAAAILRDRGGSMVLVDPVSTPRRLLTLIEEAGLRPAVEVRYTDRAPMPLEEGGDHPLATRFATVSRA